MKIISVKRRWFEDSGVRLDASYHLSEGLITLRKLKKCPYPTSFLKDETENIFKGGIFRRTYVDSIENGYEFITASEMMKSDLSGGKFISKKYSDIDHLFVENGWTLVSRSGTLGNTVYTSEIFKGKVLTDDLIRIVPNNKNVLSGYLYAFLTSHYGYGLLTQSGYGGVIQHIEPHHIENIPIPILPEETQQKIHNLIVESAQLRVEANKLLKEAVEIFEKENEILKNINSDDFLFDISENKKEIGRKVKVSDKFKITFKARNFSMRAEKIAKIYEKKNGIRLGNFVEKPFEMGARASFKRIDNENFKGTDLISQGDIHKQNPKIFKQVKIKKSGEIDYASKATVILPSAGTLGENEIFTRPLLIRNNFEGKLLSEVIGKFICRTEIDAAYLYIFLKYPLTFRILRAMVYGTNLMYPNWNLIKDLKIPISSNEMKEKIGNIVLNAFDIMSEANLNENQAIDLIEKEIDQWQQ